MSLIRRGSDVSRLESFSDAVFAFSATLLVVSLKVPDTFPALVAELKGFAAFALSFGALVLIWSVHNAFFRRYGLRDRWTVFLNACLLFVVLFYVFPLRFIVEGMAGSLFGLRPTVGGLTTWEDLSLLFQLYSGGFLALFLCVALLYLHAYRQRDELKLDDKERAEARFYFRHYLIFVLVALLSILLARQQLGLNFGLPGVIYSLLGPLCWGHGVLSARRDGRGARAGAARGRR